MSLVLRLPREMHLSRSSSNVPRLPSFLEILHNPHVLLTFGQMQNPLPLSHKTTSEPSKLVRACGAFKILTWKCASRHNCMHFSDISTSKSAPNLVCFAHFKFQNVLRATTACTFSTSQLLKIYPKPRGFAHFDLEMCFAPQRHALFQHHNFQKCSENGALYILASKCASHHNGVQFFISHLARWLRTRRFSEPTFRPSGATNH